jgi:hypothetical protein
VKGHGKLFAIDYRHQDTRVGADHNWKIRARKQRTGVGKYSSVNRTITDWNKLTEVEIGAVTGNYV